MMKYIRFSYMLASLLACRLDRGEPMKGKVKCGDLTLNPNPSIMSQGQPCRSPTIKNWPPACCVDR